MRRILVLVCVAVRLSLPVFAALNGRTEFESKMFESGREQFEMVSQKSSIPRQGDCWKAVLKSLHSGCDRLDENQHSMLALGLADCFLEMSGEEKHSCGLLELASDRAQCIKGMPDRAFGVFTKFFTHVANMCYFLKSSLWHEIAQNTMDSLLSVSQVVDGQLNEIKDKNEILIDYQQKSINLQEQAIDSGANLGQVLKESRDSVAMLMLEIRENTLEQQLAIVDLSQRLSALQSWAVGEVSWLESLAYFLLAICTTYLTTAWSRASEARGWIFVILFVGVMLEQAIFKLLLSHYEGASSMFQKENLYFWVWKLRYLVVALCVSVYVFCVATFVDYSQVNHKLLNSIHEIVKDMQISSSALDVISSSSRTLQDPPARDFVEDSISSPGQEDTNRSRRETSVTFVRVEQKTYRKSRSRTPARSKKKTMAIFEVDEITSPGGSRYNLRRNTPLPQLN